MFVDWQVNHRSPYALGRNYIGSNAYPAERFDLPDEWIYTKEKEGVDMWGLIELNEQHCWMDDYIYERLNKYPMRDLAKLSIWTPEFMSYYKLQDPRPWYVKIVHRYLERTQSYQHNLFVRTIDYLLKRVC